MKKKTWFLYCLAEKIFLGFLGYPTLSLDLLTYYHHHDVVPFVYVSGSVRASLISPEQLKNYCSFLD